MLDAAVLVVARVGAVADGVVHPVERHDRVGEPRHLRVKVRFRGKVRVRVRVRVSSSPSG